MSLMHINKADLREATLSPGFRDKSRNIVSGKRTNHNISFHRNYYQEKEKVIIDLPRLSSDDVIVLDSINFCFNIDMNSNTKSWFKNNLAKMLQDRLEVSMDRRFMKIQRKVFLKYIKTFGYRTKSGRTHSNMGLRTKTQERLFGASSGNEQKVSDEQVADLSEKQKISLNKVLMGNGPFCPFGLNNELTCKIRLPSSDELLDVQSSQTKGKYSLKNCELEYQTPSSPGS